MAEATSLGTIVRTFKTSADLSGSAWCAVKLNSSGEVVLSTAPNNADIGVLTDEVADGSSTADFVSVQLYGPVARAKAGGTIAAGAAVKATSAGALVTASTGDRSIGVALTAASSGQIFEVALIPTVAL